LAVGGQPIIAFIPGKSIQTCDGQSGTGACSSPNIPVSPVSIIPPVFHFCLHIKSYSSQMDKWTKPGNFPAKVIIFENGGASLFHFCKTSSVGRRGSLPAGQGLFITDKIRGLNLAVEFGETRCATVKFVRSSETLQENVTLRCGTTILSTCIQSEAGSV
jgi:hypothetical protein